jgi:hypothetical protein
MIDTVEVNGRVYHATYSQDTLIPENVTYIDEVRATVKTPKGYCPVTSARILQRIYRELNAGIESN